MSRVRTLFVLILPSALAGGLLCASAFSRADAGSGGSLGYWPDASEAPRSGRVLVAQVEPMPNPRPAVPAPPIPALPPAPPAPPAPPSHRSHGRHGFSLSIHDGKVEVDGISELVQESLEKALETLDRLPDLPTDTRMRLRGRIQGVRNHINSRLSRLRSMDIDKVGPEIERIGDEIERQMEGVDQELAQLGESIGKSFAKKFGKDLGKDIAKSFGPGNPSVNQGGNHDSDDGDDDDDDDDDNERTAVTVPATPGPDVADQDVGPAIAALKGLTLDASQRAALARLRADSDRQITAAKRDLDKLSTRLHDALRDSEASEADIARQIDTISSKEAAIRKARILTWIKVRHLLRDDQRKQVEDAVQNR
ncbi:MAG TPA: hypothetical protein VHW23_47460 [Kofleriaceae bacterium]|nr:hypothetical protein [Kofleriaceae bacterium]